MKIQFSDERIDSPAFVATFRPSAEVWLQSRATGKWYPVTMIVDSGADATLLPRWIAQILGIDLKRDGQPVEMSGVGGDEIVWLVRNVNARLGTWERWIPIGFLDHDNIMPLLGRKDFFETFRVTFTDHTVTFSEPRASRRVTR